MKKALIFVLCAALSLSLFACAKDEAKTTETTEAVETTQAPETEPQTFAEVENPLTYFSATLSEDGMEFVNLTAQRNENATATIGYEADEKKLDDLDVSAMDHLTAELEKSGLAEFNGAELYEEGMAYASVYAEFEDGTFMTANLSGTISEEFKSAFAALQSSFETLMADVPVYVPQLMIYDVENSEICLEALSIMEQSGIENPDSFYLSAPVKDSSYPTSLGLTTSEGLVDAAVCQPLMSTTAYSFVIVQVESAEYIDAVRKNFEANLDWGKWVCVRPTDALIATKGNFILCLMGADELYTMTKTGIELSGWTDILELKCP